MSTERQDSTYEFRGFQLEPGTRRVFRANGEPLTLGTKEFDTLLFLVEHAGEPVSKDELLAAVWPGLVVEQNNLNQAISKLRQALGDNRRDPDFIATLPGRGYQFVAGVKRLSANSDSVGDRPERKAYPPRLWLGLAALGVVVIAVTLWSFRPAEPPPATSLDGARLVTRSAASHSMPTLSPDGTLMAFVSDRSGIDQIWVQGLPDGNPVQITHGDEPAVSPSWSPVDDAILFQRASPEGYQSIWITDPLASRPPRLVVTNGRGPRFAADGRAFTFTRGVHSIYIGTLDSNETRQLEGLPETPGFASPEPAMNAAGDIAFVLADEGPSGNLWVYRAATGAVRQLTTSDNEFAGVWAAAPVWMPNGESILYTAADGEPTNTHLWQVNSRTGEIIRLSAGVGGYAQPALSGDGSRLLYAHAKPLSRLVRTSPESGTETIIHESREGIALPATSRDGSNVVYFFDNIYTQRVDGGEPVQLTFSAAGEATLPAWSRSEDIIYYYDKRALHRLDPSRGISESVVEDFHWSKKNWLAVHGSKLAYWLRRPFGPGRTIILDTATNTELTLEEPLLPTDWSRDGKTLLGRTINGSGLMTCTAPEFTCVPILEGDEPVAGAIPRWSSDESRVFFRRARHDKPGYAYIWVVDANGGEARSVAEIGPYQPPNMFFAIANDDSIIWNQYDSLGRSEIWLAEPPAISND